MAPPPPVQLTIFHKPLVLHDQIEVVCPPATMLVSAIDDTHACMDRLEQRFRQVVMKLMYVHLIHPWHRFMILMFDDHDLDERY